jgi:hypothetical protein
MRVSRVVFSLFVLPIDRYALDEKARMTPSVAVRFASSALPLASATFSCVGVRGFVRQVLAVSIEACLAEPGAFAGQ